MEWPPLTLWRLVSRRYGFSLDRLNAVVRFDGDVATVTHVQHIDLCDRSHLGGGAACGGGGEPTNVA